MATMKWLCCKRSAPAIKDDVTFIVVGLDNAGKSTLVSSLKRELDAHIVPTIGFNEPVRLRRNKTNIRVFDVGGGPRIRGVWDQYFAEVHGIIYVVDSADGKQLAESASVFTSLLAKDQVHGKPILVFANKQDLPGAKAEVDISVDLNIAALRTPHSVVKCIAHPQKNGGAIDEAVFTGLDWLVGAVQSDLVSLAARVTRDTEAAKKEREARRAAQRVKQEQYRKEKAEREARIAAGQEVEKQKKSAGAAASNAILCTVCKFREATGRAAVSKWMAICDKCKHALENGLPPPIPDDAPAAAAAPAPAPAPAPSSGGPKCAVCNEKPAVRKSGKLGWKPVCEGCDPDNQVEAAADAVADAGGAATGAVAAVAAGAGAAGAGAGAAAAAASADATSTVEAVGAGVGAAANDAGAAVGGAAGSATDAAVGAAAAVSSSVASAGDAAGAAASGAADAATGAAGGVASGAAGAMDDGLEEISAVATDAAAAADGANVAGAVTQVVKPHMAAMSDDVGEAANTAAAQVSAQAQAAAAGLTLPGGLNPALGGDAPLSAPGKLPPLEKVPRPSAGSFV